MKIPLIWLKDYIDIKKSPKEIADSFTSLGLMLDKPIKDDVLDLEHRMDRSDWLSIIGCARDLSAMEGLRLKFPELNKLPGKQPSKDQMVDIKVECPDLVKRFNTRIFRGIKVKPSPKWLSERLESYGIPSINNIVDITNFVMVELGQPMHAQDLSKMEKQEIVIRRAHKDEEITTLLGQNLKLNSNNFVLTQNGKATVLGGIVGTKLTAVDENTTDIVLDAGNYDQVNVRKSSREHKVQNETVLRYDKFLHPKLCEIATERATKLILELAGGEYYQNIDYYPSPLLPKKMKLRFSRIKQVSGMEIGKTRIEMTLISLEDKIINKSEEYFEVEVPYFRTDVEVEDDFVSDILRINNYKNIPFDLMNMAPPAEITPDIYKFEEKLRDIFVNLGLKEYINNPLELPDENNKQQIVLENSFSVDRSALRTCLKPALLKVAENYRKHKVTKTALFEIGKVFKKKGSSGRMGDFIEEREAGILIYDDNKDILGLSAKMKIIASGVFKYLGIENAEYKETNSANGVLAKIEVNGECIGELEYDSALFYTESLMKSARSKNNYIIKTSLENIRTEDISITIPVKQKIGEIYYTVKNFSENITDVEILEEFIDEKTGGDKKSVLLRIFYKGDIAEKKISIIQIIEAKYGAVIRSLPR